MTLIVPTAGDLNALDMWLSDASPEAQTLKLFTNAITPAKGDTAGTYTEAAGSGYVAKALARATWSAAITSGSVGSKAYSAAQTWSWSGSITIVGYYVIKASAGTILWSELIAVSSSGVLFNNGDTLSITPTITLN